MAAKRGWRRRVRRTLTAMLVFVLALVVAVGGYLGYVAIRHARPVTLPAPTGRYRVGRAMFDWTDRSRTDPLAPRPGTPRELSVWLWYPAAHGTGGRPAPYLPGGWGRLHFPGIAGLGETSFAAVRDHALAGAPVAAGRFPIAVLEPGLGLAAPQYTTLGENLASHGYLVAGMTPTYSANITVLRGRVVQGTAAGNPAALNADLHTAAARRTGDRLVDVWASDARFAARRVAGLAGRFAGHVDPAGTAYLGHSFGGAAALEACRTDAHCAAAVDLDGAQFGRVARTGLRVPVMLMESEDSCVTGTCGLAGAANAADRATARGMLAAGTGRSWCYRINGMRHFNFSDYATYYLAAPLRPLLALGRIDGDLGLRITDAYLVAFLDHAVRGRPEPLLSGPAARYPEVQAQQ